MIRRIPLAAVLLGSVAAPALAQTHDDLTFVRNRPTAYSSLLQLRAGLLGGVAADEDPAIGLENELGFDGSIYYHGAQFGGRDAQLDAYAGRDGAYIGVVEGAMFGGGNRSRLELSTRYFPFYREGFYSGNSFIPTGRYEALDYGVGLSIGREAAEDLTVEVGLFWRRNDFERNGSTSPSYTTPDDYNAYGWRGWLEHNTLQLNRLSGRPESGFILTLGFEHEFNDSDRRFGTVGIFESTLPAAVWRGRGHLEWYFPQSDSGVWELRVDGSWSDKKDRVYNYDAQKPIGHIWADGSIGYRLDIGRSLAIAPKALAQFIKAVDENGRSSSNELFFGGGVDLGFDLGANVSLLGEYSYLSNESRPPVSASKDTFGEHRFFVGLEVRFAGQRR
jgi:hypothetical protein